MLPRWSTKCRVGWGARSSALLHAGRGFLGYDRGEGVVEAGPLEQFNPEDLANTAWAFTTLGMRQEELSDAIVGSPQIGVGEKNSGGRARMGAEGTKKDVDEAPCGLGEPGRAGEPTVPCPDLSHPLQAAPR